MYIYIYVNKHGMNLEIIVNNWKMLKLPGNSVTGGLVNFQALMAISVSPSGITNGMLRGQKRLRRKLLIFPHSLVRFAKELWIYEYMYMYVCTYSVTYDLSTRHST